MKKTTITSVCIAALMATSTMASAKSITVESIVVRSVQIETQGKRVITPVKTCNIVEVPVYGNSGKAQTGEVLGGAIIGGILGNQVGGGKGKDAATILGAILGADFANKKGGKQNIIGYRQVQQCEITNQVTYNPGPVRCQTTVRVPALDNMEYTFVGPNCQTKGSQLRILANITFQKY